MLTILIRFGEKERHSFHYNNKGMTSLLKHTISKILVVIFAIGFILAGCSSPGETKTAQVNSSANGTKPIKGEIVVGGWPSGDKAIEAIIPEFNKKYPDVKVTLQFQKSDDHHNKLLTALAAGSGAPDVAMLEAGYIGKYRDKKGFVNLYDAPYNAKRFENDFVDYKYQMAISLDGKQMIGVPWDIGPISLFYRRDIFKEVGLPDEPAEVQKLLSTWDGYLDVARKVSIPGKRWMVNNAADVFMSRWANRDYYNPDLSFRFDDQKSLDLLGLSATLRKEGLDAKVALYSNEMYALIKNGQIATHISGAWFGGFLKTFVAPDTAGKWGVVKVPGESVTNWGGSFLTIPEQSKNKEAAWAFIEFALANKDSQNAMFKAVDYFPAYKPAWDDPIYHDADPFFGNQKTRELWVDIAKNTKPSFVTMMDKQTENIMRSAISTGLDQGIDPKAVLDKVKQQIITDTVQDRKAMEELLKKVKK
ncbi:sugar ABC transporter substrate-binding protein [Paenibacillus filicis]|uniref:Sugar ABC transporter substrate-binding protein n=1 Tax=Paenibacillus gyeongsangnamensis TaxID=3388067 RepID=A0ABT4QH06_9BACL|nr:sugar ABC transporter substrate-binding protein [Paenibacillus filicis]MCZ8516134.1 sugar ABC transporter substrate-binding protein [Paenibacillus filicis]